MHELISRCVVFVVKPGSLGELVDRSFIAGQEMPSGGGAGALVPVDVCCFLVARQLRRFSWIEAYGDDFKLLADIERDDIERAGQSVQHLIAEHRTRVVDECEHNWLLSKIIPK